MGESKKEDMRISAAGAAKRTVIGRLSCSSVRIRYDALRKTMKLSGATFDKDLVAERGRTWGGGVRRGWASC